MKITSVRVFTPNLAKISALEASKQQDKPDNAQDMSWISETVIANPMSIYPEYFERRSSWLWVSEEVIVQIDTDEGVTGIGTCPGGAAAASLIKQHLSRFLIGQNPFQVERLWDILFKTSLPYGRKGLPIMAISAIDLALWDCISKARNEPLYQSLGGQVKDKVHAYVTGNNYSRTKELGYYGQKLAMPYGPASGYEGMHKNAELVRRTREALGPDIEIMCDCYMAWDVHYTIRMAEMLAPYRVKWIEECLPPDDYEGYGIINRTITSTAVATGEHEFTRYGFRQLLNVRGAEILQPDICWCGGLTEAKKICAMASADHLTVIPHAGGIQPWALHLVFATPNIPLAEYFIGADPTEDPIFEVWNVPVNGWFHLPQAPGAGIHIRESAYELLNEH